MTSIDAGCGFDSLKKEMGQLRLRLAATRLRWLAAQVGAGKALALAILVGGLSLEMALDWLVHLPWLARACLSLPAIGGAAWILYRDALLPLLRMPGDHAMACCIERELPIFQTRLIASIQLGRKDRARKSTLVGALIRETVAIAALEDFRKAVKMEKLISSVRLLACALVVAGGVVWMSWGSVVLLMQRALLLTARLPTRTRIEKIECPAKIAEGEDLKIEVDADGVIPADGEIEAQMEGVRSKYRLEGTGGGHFYAVIRNVGASMTFVARLNDATSNVVNVLAISPPVVTRVRCVEDFPPYTKLASIELPTGDLTLLAGSVLRVSVIAGDRIAQASAHLAGLEQDVSLSVDQKIGRLARGAIPIPKAGLTGFSLRLVNADGIASRATAVYPIDIVQDRAPTVEITEPDRNETATAKAEEVVAFNAVDDFGVSKVLLHYVMNHGAEKVVDFHLAGTSPRKVVRRFDWKLETLNMVPGGTIEYWLEAVDGNDVTGPGRGFSEHAQIKIVTDEEKREELAERTSETLGSLDDVSQGEESLAKHVGAQIFQKPGGGNP